MNSYTKLSVLLIALVATLSPAHATNCGNDKEVGNAQGCGPKVKPPTTNTTTTTNAVNTINTNTNTNSNRNDNSNKNSIVNSNSNTIRAEGGAGGVGGAGGEASSTSTATGGRASATGGSATSAVTVGPQSQSQKASANNANNARQSASNAVTVNGDTTTYQAQERHPASTAYAPSIAPTAVCALGASGGVQGAAFGFSFGNSYVDKNCELLEQVRAAKAIGATDIALEMMMDVPSFAAAKQRIENRKNGLPVKAVDGPAKVEYTDPIIRSRLGLPPL